jgi:hypothetical protein
METNLAWQDDGQFSHAQFGVLKLSVEYEGAMHPKGSDLPIGYRVSVEGYKKRQLKHLFNNMNNAQIAAERLLWKIVNEMYQDLSQYPWDTHNKEEVKWVQR